MLSTITFISKLIFLKNGNFNVCKINSKEKDTSIIFAKGCYILISQDYQMINKPVIDLLSLPSLLNGSKIWEVYAAFFLTAWKRMKRISR